MIHHYQVPPNAPKHFPKPRIHVPATALHHVRRVRVCVRLTIVAIVESKSPTPPEGHIIDMQWAGNCWMNAAICGGRGPPLGEDTHTHTQKFVDQCNL